jgi:hypothetical protein
MPYAKGAKVELVSLRSSGTEVPITGEVITADKGKASDEGYFYAVWRRENPTKVGEHYKFVSTTGKGHLVGLILQAQGLEPGGTPFFEGDDQTTIDGRLVVHGTGSEDFFNGGWYAVPGRWDHRFSRALSGCLGYDMPAGRTGGYRLFLGDAYSFKKSLLQTIEHSPEGNSFSTDYCSVAFLYSDTHPDGAGVVPSAAEREVVEPKRLVFGSTWLQPIQTFSMNNGSLKKVRVKAGGEEPTVLAFDGGVPEWYGPPFLQLGVSVPAAGRYRVFATVVAGPQSGHLQLFDGDVPVGKAVDLYSAEREIRRDLLLGEVEFAAGPGPLMLKVPAKNDSSPTFGFELISVTLERV